jgi:hypothetical protein
VREGGLINLCIFFITTHGNESPVREENGISYIIEPLVVSGSVSISITTTDKADVTEFGPPEEVSSA